MRPYLKCRTESVHRNRWILMLFLCLVMMSGCHYYKITSKSGYTAEDLKWELFNNKYLIVHYGRSAWHLEGIEIRENDFTGTVSVLPDSRMQFKKHKYGGRYHVKDEDLIMDQVHLHVSDSLFSGLSPYDRITLPYSSVNAVEVYEKNKGKSAGATTGLVLGIGVGIAGVVAIIVAATKSSCPLVYIKKGNDYEFAGEIFGGSVYPSLERHDYMPLPGFRAENGRYRLKIANKLPEIQYINLAELWIVNHPYGVTVLPDRQGNMHSISEPQAPVTARTQGGNKIGRMITAKDTLAFHFDEPPSVTGDTNAFNSVVLEFTLPEASDTGKLVIRAGNSLWGDYTYGEFTELFGWNYGEWIRKQRAQPSEVNNRWRVDQRFALLAYLETPDGWQYIDYFDLIGPLGARDLVMPVDLARALVHNHDGQAGTIRIKLESGFKFWDLDYAAMDFTTDVRYETIVAGPASVINESGKDVTSMVKEDDALYYIQQTIGEEGFAVYRDTPARPGMIKSVFLHSKGYYEHIRNYPGPPQKELLQTFVIPGRFSRFSYDNYTELSKNNWAFATDPQLP